MNKTDLIKFRCTPQFKATLQREAAYRQITLTELVEEALEPFAQTAVAARAAELPTVVDMGEIVEQRVAGIDQRPFEVILRPTTGLGASANGCTHGRPAGMCWECA